MSDTNATTPTVTTTTTSDGRRQRRERGRAAVTTAMIDLVMEGHLPPTTEQLAQRADVSVASVFRYFDGLDDLRQSAAAAYFERYEHLFSIEQIGDGPLADRIARFVDARLTLYATAEPIGRLVRVRAHDDDRASDNVRRLRDTYADQIRHHFDAELAPLKQTDSEALVVAIATLTSFESWDQCRHHHGFDDATIRSTWNAAVASLIGGTS